MEPALVSVSPPPRAQSLMDIPFDLFLVIARFLDVHACLALSATCATFREYCAAPSMWLGLTSLTLHTRPLPVPPLRTLSSLSLAEQRQSAIQAARLESNFSRRSPRLQSSAAFDIDGGQHLELLAILPGARHLVTCKNDNDIACWDLHTGECIASWPFGEGDRVLQCRPVDGGRSCMFIVFVQSAGVECVRNAIVASADCGDLSSRGWFQLLRLQFNVEDDGSITAEFEPHIKFNEPEHFITDMSLSEDVITMLTVSSTYDVSVVLLSWREGALCVGRTNIELPSGSHPVHLGLFTLLAPDSVNVLLDDQEQPTIHTYPNDALFSHLSVTPGDPILLPSVPTRPVKFENNSDKFLIWQPHSSLAHRTWDTSLRGDVPHLARALSDWRTFELTLTKSLVLSHCTLPVPYDDRPHVRIFFAPFEVVVSPPGTDPRHALIIAESKHAVWLERLPGDAVVLRMCSFPPDDMRALKESPQWYTDRLVRTLEVPKELDLYLVCDLALNEAHGIIVLSLLDGTLCTLQY